MFSPEEQWRPGKSTLLQVLISIQSMILNDVPYFNEFVSCPDSKRNLSRPHFQAWPRAGEPKRSHASIAYNTDICAKTVKWAIVDWLRDDNRRWIWRVKVLLLMFCRFLLMFYLQDVIASHFKINKDKIRAR
jgi:hypothetical protein